MTFLVPTMIYVLLDYPDLKKYDTSSLRNVIYGASAIASDRLKQALNTFGPIFTQLFGQTEAPMMITAVLAMILQTYELEFRPVSAENPVADFGFEIHPSDQIRMVARRAGD